MRALQDLRRFIQAKDSNEERHEVREYVLVLSSEVARAFGVTQEAFTTAIEKVGEDAALARLLLAEVKRTEARTRQAKIENRARAAQQAADALARTVQWEQDRARVDIQALLRTALTRRTDLLVFHSDAFDTAISQKPLLALAKLQKTDLSAFVDLNGLHIRWGTGGLNLCHQIDHDAERIVINLPAQSGAAVAA